MVGEQQVLHVQNKTKQTSFFKVLKAKRGVCLCSRASGVHSPITNQYRIYFRTAVSGIHLKKRQRKSKSHRQDALQSVRSTKSSSSTLAWVCNGFDGFSNGSTEWYGLLLELTTAAANKEVEMKHHGGGQSSLERIWPLCQHHFGWGV